MLRWLYFFCPRPRLRHRRPHSSVVLAAAGARAARGRPRLPREPRWPSARRGWQRGGGRSGLPVASRRSIHSQLCGGTPPPLPCHAARAAVAAGRGAAANLPPTVVRRFVREPARRPRCHRGGGSVAQLPRAGTCHSGGGPQRRRPTTCRLPYDPFLPPALPLFQSGRHWRWARVWSGTGGGGGGCIPATLLAQTGQSTSLPPPPPLPAVAPRR